MKIKRLEIRNFRSLENIDIEIDNRVAIVGKNDVGKSSILNALQALLGENKIDKYDIPWSLPDGEMGKITGHFEVSPEYDQVSSRFLHENSKVEFCLEFSIDGNNKIKQQNRIKTTRKSIPGLSDTWSELTSEIKTIAQINNINGTNYRNQTNKARLREIIESCHENLINGNETIYEEIDATEFRKFLPRVLFIPAQKDLSKDLDNVKSELIFSLIRSRILPEIKKLSEFNQIMNSLNTLNTTLLSDDHALSENLHALERTLETTWKKILQEPTLKLTLKSSRIEASELEKICIESFNLKFSSLNGSETVAENQGHGSQRTLLYSLIELISSSVDSDKISHILLFEEPELFMHPHILSNLKKVLIQLSQKSNWQIFYTTHSPFLIDIVEDYKSLAILSIQNKNKMLYQLKNDPFQGEKDLKTVLRASLDFHPTVCTAFFATSVILVEGDTESAVLASKDELCKYAGILEDDIIPQTTVVSCGGKWTIPAIAHILSQFTIPFKIIHDLDLKERDPNTIKAGIDPYNANQRIKETARNRPILIVEDTFEDLVPEIKNLGGKPFSAWKAVNELISNGEINESIQELAKFCFSKTYRNNEKLAGQTTFTVGRIKIDLNLGSVPA